MMLRSLLMSRFRVMPRSRSLLMMPKGKPCDARSRHEVYSSYHLGKRGQDLQMVKPHEYQSRRFVSSPPLGEGEGEQVQKPPIIKPQNSRSKQPNRNIFVSLLRRVGCVNLAEGLNTLIWLCKAFPKRCKPCPAEITERVIAAAKVAMKVYNMKEGTKLEVKRVLRVELIGIFWRISMEASDNCLYEALVSIPAMKGPETAWDAVSRVKKDVIGMGFGIFLSSK